MLAHDARTVVDIDFASVASESRFAGALEAVTSSHASRAVSARIGGAGVGFERTVGARVADGTHADVAGGAGLADATVPAGLVGAREAARLAARALVALRAGARQLAALVGHARATVEAGPHGARVQRLLAVRPRVLRGTHASVAALPRIMTRAAVPTRAVVGAVVEVLVAEQPAPALLADAVPGPRAGAVHAARMPLALVAQLAHPARMTTGIKENIR